MDIDKILTKHHKGKGKAQTLNTAVTTPSKTCGFCGKPNHTAMDCWNNPKSPKFRGKKDKKSNTSHKKDNKPKKSSKPTRRFKGPPRVMFHNNKQHVV